MAYKASNPINILWLRRDLRINDNHILNLALKQDLTILPIFIFDTKILDKLEEKTDLRLQFIHQQLTKMNTTLGRLGSGIKTFHDAPKAVFKKILSTYNVDSIYYGEDFEPNALKRDEEINQIAKKHNVKIVTGIDHLIHHPASITKSDLSPYRVYTPYSKQWLARLDQSSLNSFSKPIDQINWHQSKEKIHSISELGFMSSNWSYPTDKVKHKIIEEYGNNRNLLPVEANSKLGIHLRFGTVNIKAIVKQAMHAHDNTFLKQLIWREFFTQIMYHYPNSMQQEFRPKYREIPWKYSDVYFSKWKEGMTGIPIVDAGMRELNQTGTMHNRARMITASWLTKNLLIDWRLGERYFASKLLDFELASNVGSWQWVAGTGCDAAPYFRIFNPYTQAKKFDPDRIYIKRWIPEIDSINYPPPMIDYADSRKACLHFYKEHMLH